MLKIIAVEKQLSREIEYRLASMFIEMPCGHQKRWLNRPRNAHDWRAGESIHCVACVYEAQVAVERNEREQEDVGVAPI